MPGGLTLTLLLSQSLWWPMQGQNPQRTNYIQGQGKLSHQDSVKVKWKFYFPWKMPGATEEKGWADSGGSGP